MLILPIINRNRIFNVEVRLKTAKKCNDYKFKSEFGPNNIYSFNKDFNSSSYNTKDSLSSSITDFIRNSDILYKRRFYVTSRENSDNFFDTYTVEYPKIKVNKGLDNLYGEAVNDLRNSVPGSFKGHYVDFAKLGITSHITPERLNTLDSIAKNEKPSNYQNAIYENDLEDLLETLNFLSLFDLEVIPKSSIKLEDFQSVAMSINKLNTKDSKMFRNYYTMALNNKECYSLISRLYNIVYNDSLNWIHNDKRSVNKDDKDVIVKLKKSNVDIQKAA